VTQRCLKRKHRRLLQRVVLLGVVASSLSARVVWAEPSESQRTVARELGTAGMEAYFDKNYARAADQLDRAYRLFSTPTLGLWSGRALIEVGQWVRAAERLREVQYASAAVGDNEAQRQAQTDAANELAALAPRIPRLSIVVEGAAPDQVQLTVDNAALEPGLIDIAQPVDPGPHRIVGLFQRQRVEVAIDAVPGESHVARVAFEPAAEAVVSPSVAAVTAAPPTAAAPVPVPAPAAASSAHWSRTASIAAFSVGGASLVGSLVLAVLANSELESCAERAGEYYCGDAAADSYESLRDSAMVAFYGGAALASAGLVLWLVQPSTDKPNSLSLAAKPFGAELSLQF
jgi:hypothetical protein